MTSSAPQNTHGYFLWRTERYNGPSRCCLSPVIKTLFLEKLMSRLDCGVSGQRSAGFQKLHVLTGAAGLHKGHQHPLALPAHQHPVGSPDIQGAERPHCHTQGEGSSHHHNLLPLTRDVEGQQRSACRC